MDHRNADGSYAEMCGNGIRLFLHVLVTEGLLDRATCEAGVLVGTRGGPRRVGANGVGGYWVDMGPARPLGDGGTVLGGRRVPGVGISMGNPHLVVLLDDPVGDVDLTTVPPVDAAMFPEGVNVEVVNVLLAGDAPAGADAHARMRVHERGVGETRSCGTGACAVASAVLAGTGRTTGTVVVDVPGGRLSVGFDGRTTVLSGPAVVVAIGTLTPEWLAG
jgi:diaminopimelate epimerase